ncbi:MAG TPA: NAD-dependent epimerase/dehydratase family protein [Roseiarcus sp.]|nr:NAD-dependent epimerase/dehydratase family protein [Roseiarcus sp.]
MSRLALAGRSVLVTGAAGFIGFFVANRLLAAGAEVVGVDNLNGYYDVALKEARLKELAKFPAFAFSCNDLTDHGAIDAAFKARQPEFVVHLAAQAGVRYSLVNPHAYVASNVDGFLTILEACRARSVRHLIYASSSSVYGAESKLPFREDDPAVTPVSLYAATKRANELMAETYAHLFDIPTTGLRFFTVYGPWGRPDMAYFSFTKAAFEGRPIDVFNDGKMRRDFTYVDDVTEAVCRLIDEAPPLAAKTLGLAIKSPHLIYNVGNHTPVELSEFIAVIEGTTARRIKQRNLPMQPGDVPATYADVDRLARVTGFAPRTPLAEGIGRFVAWYRKFYGV